MSLWYVCNVCMIEKYEHTTSTIMIYEFKIIFKLLIMFIVYIIIKIPQSIKKRIFEHIIVQLLEYVAHYYAYANAFIYIILFWPILKVTFLQKNGGTNSSNLLRTLKSAPGVTGIFKVLGVYFNFYYIFM